MHDEDDADEPLTPEELALVAIGEAEIARGDYVTLEELLAYYRSQPNC